jgi:hypothetical protein
VFRRWLVVPGLLLLTTPAAAHEPPPARYYVLLFGGQGNVLRPRTAHTWATYVRTEPRPDGTVGLEQFSNSWLPATLTIRPWAFRPEPGVNLDLGRTLAYLSDRRPRIALWGPYEITEAYYHDAARQWRELESGAYSYRILDLNRFHPHVSHCVHAITRTTPAVNRATPPILWFGEYGTAPVAAALVRSGVVIDRGATHDWLLPALGLDGHQFVRH